MKNIVIISFLCVFIFGFSSLNNDELYKLSITHFNDTHTTFNEKDIKFEIDNESITLKTGSYSRLINAIKEIKENNKNTLNLFAGDALQIGNIFYDAFGIDFDCKMLQMLQIDAMAVGNHEFDGKIEGFKNLVNCIKSSNKQFPILASNLDLDDELLKKIVMPYTIKNINGKDIGIIGLSVDDTSSIGSIDGITFIDSVKIVNKLVSQLKSKGIDIIILLTHIGFDKDVELAKAVKDIDLIVGGHSHTLQGDFSSLGINTNINKYPYIVENSGKTLIVTASAFTQNIGIIDIIFDKNGRVVSFDGSSKFLVGVSDIDKDISSKLKNNKLFYVTNKSKEAEKIVSYYQKQLDPKLFKEKFTTEINLKTLRNSTNIFEDIKNNDHSSLGYVVANGIYSQIKNIDGVVINTGSIKQGFDIGVVLEWQFKSAVPYTNDIMTFDILGKDLKLAIKKSIENGFNDSVNAMPVIAGFIVEFKYIKNTKKVEILSIKSLKDNSIISDKKLYKIATTSFLLNNNGDKYLFSKYAKNIINNNITDKKLLDEYFIKNKIIKNSINTLKIIE